jgi:hypothetical protein
VPIVGHISPFHTSCLLRIVLLFTHLCLDPKFSSIGNKTIPKYDFMVNNICIHNELFLEWYCFLIKIVLVWNCRLI